MARNWWLSPIVMLAVLSIDASPAFAQKLKTIRQQCFERCNRDYYRCAKGPSPSPVNVCGGHLGKCAKRCERWGRY